MTLTDWSSVSLADYRYNSILQCWQWRACYFSQIYEFYVCQNSRSFGVMFAATALQCSFTAYVTWTFVYCWRISWNVSSVVQWWLRNTTHTHTHMHTLHTLCDAEVALSICLSVCLCQPLSLSWPHLSSALERLIDWYFLLLQLPLLPCISYNVLPSKNVLPRIVELIYVQESLVTFVAVAFEMRCAKVPDFKKWNLRLLNTSRIPIIVVR